MVKHLKIGTRGSDLAMTQTKSVCSALTEHFPDLDIEIVVIQTSGDWKPEHGETRLSEADGGKGLFAKEIEKAILDKRIDCGIHSMKDMPSYLDDGLEIMPILQRENPLDAFLSKNFKTLDDLPNGASIGTSSTRRASYILNKRPDIKIVPIRGNVPTRIEKMANGHSDAIILAAAGLSRLNLEKDIQHFIQPEIMLPSACQGVIAAEYKIDDTDTKSLFDKLIHTETALCAEAERAALQCLDGSCKTPIGAYAEINDGIVSMHVAVLPLDGSCKYEASAKKALSDIESARAFGYALAMDVKAKAPDRLFEL